MPTTSPNTTQPRLSYVATLSGWVLVVLSAVALAGWVVQLPGLPPPAPGSQWTKVNTALAFLLGGLSLIRRNHRDHLLYATGVFALGAGTLVEYLTNFDLGIDQFLIRDSDPAIFPGRMSEITSMGFTLLGPSLALMKSKQPILRQCSRGLGFLIGALGAIVVLSHSYDTHSVSQVRPYTVVSFYAAVSFMIGATGLAYANPFEGIVRLIHTSDAGGRMLRRLLPAGLLVPLLLGFAVTTAQKQFRWEAGFALALVAGAVIACLGTIIVLNAEDLERENLRRRESEQRFSLVANTAPVMIWMSGTDKLCNYFNEPWLQFTGRALEDELGNGWAEGVHADDLKECLATYVTSFDRRQAFQMQYRLRSHDGEYRWIFDTGVPRFDGEGFFAGYIGSCIDITERKVAEEALADLELRVLSAQEEERSRIARELHDDINQRIAILGWELRASERGLLDRTTEPRISTDSLVERLVQISADIQRISRRLHSSHLEYLGLAGAAGVLCNDLRDQQHAEIDFICEGIPRDLPRDVSLCLYRVLQEALQNALKHSGVLQFRVELVGNPTEVLLTVRDEGTGFDQRKGDQRHGLGLISMRERTRLAHGEFTVKSEPGRGTTVWCRVPMPKETASVTETQRHELM